MTELLKHRETENIPVAGILPVDPIDTFTEAHCPSWISPYELDEPAIRQLTEKLCDEKYADRYEGYAPFIVDGIRSYNGESMGDLGRIVESAVFQDKFKDKPDALAEEFEPYEDQSIFSVVVDLASRMPVGVMRIIKNGPMGLKSINDLDKLESMATIDLKEEFLKKYSVSDMDTVYDIATLAINKDHRSLTGEVSTILYKMLDEVTQAQKIQHLVAIMDRAAYRQLKFIGLPVQDFMDIEPFQYATIKNARAVYIKTPDCIPSAHDAFDKIPMGKAGIKSAALANLLQEPAH